MIYMWTSKTSNKSYIGKTKYSAEKRLIEHITSTNKGSKYHFHRAIRKYGVDDFMFTELEQIFKCDNDSEKYWIEYYDTYNKGYNMTKGGDGGNTGGMKPETKARKLLIGDDGLNEFQKQSTEGWKTRRKNGNDISSIVKGQEKMNKIGEDGLSQHQRNAISCSENWKNKTEEEKTIISEKMKTAWKNKTEEEKIEFSKMRSEKAREQMLNETQETKDYRKNRCSEACTKTVSAYNLRTKENKRVDENEWNNNCLLGGITKYITKATFNNREYYMFNPMSYKKFSEDFNCGKEWVRGLSSEGKPFSTPYKKFKHLEGIVRERLLISDLTDEIIDKIEKLSYI